MGLFERLGKSNAKKQTYEALSRAQRYGLDKEKPEARDAHEAGIKEAAFDGAFFQMQMKVTSNLLKSLNRKNPEDKEAEMSGLKKEIDERVRVLKKSPTESSLEDLRSWAFSKAHMDFHEPVAKAFADLREDLVAQGIALTHL